MDWGKQTTYQMVKEAVTDGRDYEHIFAVVLADVEPLVKASRIPENDWQDVVQEICISVLQQLTIYVQKSGQRTVAERNSWLKRVAARRIADYWRAYYYEEKETVADNGREKVTRNRKLSLSLFGGEKGEERDIPQDQREFYLLEEDDRSQLFRLLTALFSIRTTPDKLLAFLFNKIILADYEGIVKNKTTAIATHFRGKRLGVIFVAAKAELQRSLDVKLPDEVFAPLQAKLNEEKDGVAYADRTFDLSPRTITDSSNWIKGRMKEWINHE